MSAGPFAKVYRSLWDGTLGQRPEAWSVFVFMLAHCGAEGVIEMTPEAIAARTGLTLEVVRRGIGVLEQPDPESRTPHQEGRRITRRDPHRSWGWQIVNYERYRFLSDAERAAAYRQRKAAAPTRHGPSRGVTGGYHAEGEAEAEAEQQTHSPAPPRPHAIPSAEQARAPGRTDGEHPGFAGFFAAYPRRLARRAASNSFHSALKRHPELQDRELVRAAEKYAREVQGGETRFVPYPAKWLDQERFLEHLQSTEVDEAGTAVQEAPMFTPEELAPPSETEKARVRDLVSALAAKLSGDG